MIRGPAAQARTQLKDRNLRYMFLVYRACCANLCGDYCRDSTQLHLMCDISSVDPDNIIFPISFEWASLWLIVGFTVIQLHSEYFIRGYFFWSLFRIDTSSSPLSISLSCQTLCMAGYRDCEGISNGIRLDDFDRPAEMSSSSDLHVHPIAIMQCEYPVNIRME